MMHKNPSQNTMFNENIAQEAYENENRHHETDENAPKMMEYLKCLMVLKQ